MSNTDYPFHPLRWGMLTVGQLPKLPWGEQAVRQFGFDRWYALTPLPGCWNAPSW